ncbi:hypothetical protein P9173_09250 [Bacillus safensis]|uniref:hypothetical protein n=1 Tax=Bacillus TaxID=1386 RepID=UPI0022824D65|nr:hypothetical protein [Bacillus safensis]MCY7542513.1 hypothetical protein [Bacillus safensis]MCY7552388.1 hypothetical protein [Bacillus safensis]MCY7644819.1 hypothetical protein [Bacillus safensis]MCY7655866.1 hypothetical protein [Bacillus safensis]MEC3710340.1 hypothetical protein [Bacillus safensis]
MIIIATEDTAPIVVIPDRTSFVFHEKSVSPSDGESLEVKHYQKLAITITGTSTSRKISFVGLTKDDQEIELGGTQLSDYRIATGTERINEAWEFSIFPFKKVALRLDEVTGGDVSVYGEVST